MKIRHATALWLSLPALLLLAVPFITLTGITHWQHLRLAWGDGAAITTSLSLGAIALVLIFLSGLPLAWWLSQARGKILWVVETLVMFPLLTPPRARGLLLVSA